MKKATFLLLFILCLSSCKKGLDEQAAAMSADYTRKYCPTPVINNERMDSLTFNATTHTFTYWKTLTGPADNAQIIQQHKAELFQSLCSAVANETQTKIYKDAGYRFRFVYHSASRPSEILFEASISPKDYNR